MLPVVLKEQKAKVIKPNPEVSVCFVLDRSGSMDEQLGNGVSKLEMVKAAVLASLNDLPVKAQVAIVTFATGLDVVVPPTSVLQREAIGKLVDTIGVGGGTVMAPSIEKAIELLGGMPGEKYLVVLTDGQTEAPSGGQAFWTSVADDARSAGIHWTSIAPSGKMLIGRSSNFWHGVPGATFSVANVVTRSRRSL
jgi:Ca-activated chloride channel family protein